MRYDFRLAELLGHTPDRRKRPGIIKAIVEYTGLDRHQVAALLKNEAKYIPLEALSRLCDYLIEHGHADAGELPGALFAVRPENFWEMLARRRRLEVCVGVRRPPDDDSADAAWIVASDAVLVGEILNGVSTLGGTSKATGDDSFKKELVPQPGHLRQSLVWSPGNAPEVEVYNRARQIYSEFTKNESDRAIVCMGSVKSNPAVELVFSSVFNAEPYKTQDDVEKASDRACPFFLRYRDSDPHPPALSAGLQLSKTEKAEKPGLYYEGPDGVWQYAGGDKPGAEAALVFYIYRESLGRLEMVLSGFSGRATRLLARTLAHRAEDFWPPVYQEKYVQVGAFVVQYETTDEARDSEDILRTDITGEATIIPLSSDVIARRLAV
jgi:hypothetical protein